ncbi:AcrR family transcriptional regulator [Actinoalloteichus hoggarensis]|uniref:DNA-binding transcriptional repressor AcrR n=1 Tax=Actinoalloteichus hoggarensis TaxID=1470176 RepID=A0A221W1L1_9PSEU|nr:TetR family transcriptional regulator [Actinoalloteichus hoggarensis]ASO19618.1 DNA-binding transcriptional repressor AcrR [Actinoalloteichus hoggarensis]MBB5919675.1 AcrR family transcriptional regulator [Actinoalloteichus hoggarensis]
MERAAEAESRTRTRTRHTILDAAVGVFSSDPAASLAEVAAAAGVARSTVQRYFPERADLLTALSDHATERVAAAARRARLDEGSAPDALSRLVQEYFDLGDILMLVTTGPPGDGTGADDGTWADEAFDALLARGHAAGTIDPTLPAEWIGQLLWSTLYAGWSHLRTNGVSRHEALTVCLRSFLKAVAP